jgi:hypothetical protein
MARKRSRPPTPDYEVGFGKPPIETRFRPGQSGNPKGRPKRAKDTRTIAQSVLNHPVAVIEGGVRKTKTLREVSLRKVAEKAASGELKSLGFLLAVAREDEAASGHVADDAAVAAADDEVIRAYLQRRTDAGK